MAAILQAFSESYEEFVLTYRDERTIDYPFVSSPLIIIGVVIFYLWFVLKVGPDFMKNRQPYDIEKFIQIYNLFQVVSCSYLTYLGVVEYFSGHTSFICGMLDDKDTPENHHVIWGSYLYVALKYVDLLDTIFFVLRKKQRQITFLHVYHHFAMCIMTWLGFLFFPAGHAIFFGTINCFVHSIMYSYYFVTLYDRRYSKNIWWKKYITILQITQFLMMFLHASLILLPSCPHPFKGLGVILAPQNLFITLMFCDFYRKTYK